MRINLMVRVVLAIVLLCIIFIQSMLVYYFWSNHKMPATYVSQSPFLLDSNNNSEYIYHEEEGYEMYSLLPQGTVFHEDSDSLNQRAYVYFDLGDLDLKFEEQSPNILLQPAAARQMRANDIETLLEYANLSKKDAFDIISIDETINETERLALYKLYKIDPSLYVDK